MTYFVALYKEAVDLFSLSDVKKACSVSIRLYISPDAKYNKHGVKQDLYIVGGEELSLRVTHNVYTTVEASSPFEVLQKLYPQLIHVPRKTDGTVLMITQNLQGFVSLKGIEI